MASVRERHKRGSFLLRKDLLAQRDIIERDELELRVPVAERELERVESCPRLHSVKDQGAPPLAQDEVNLGDVRDLLSELQIRPRDDRLDVLVHGGSGCDGRKEVHDSLAVEILDGIQG